MSLSKYIDELKNDCIVDEINLKESALILPAKKAKWVSRLILNRHALEVIIHGCRFHFIFYVFT